MPLKTILSCFSCLFLYFEMIPYHARYTVSPYGVSQGILLSQTNPHSDCVHMIFRKNQDTRPNEIFLVFRLVASAHFAAPPIKQFFPLTHLLRRLKHAPRTVAMLAKCANASYVWKGWRPYFIVLFILKEDGCEILQRITGNISLIQYEKYWKMTWTGRKRLSGTASEKNISRKIFFLRRPLGSAEKDRMYEIDLLVSGK